MKRPGLLALVVVVVGSAVVVFWIMFRGNSVPVQLTALQHSALNTSIHTNGKVEAERVFEIRAPLSGMCRRILAREGDVLSKGDVLLILDDTGIHTELAAAHAELDAAELDLRNVRRGPTPEELNQVEAEIGRLRLEVENARRLLEANEWLLVRGAITRREVDQSRETLALTEHSLQAAITKRDDLKTRFSTFDEKRAAARVDAARARIQQLERSRALTLVRAPASGTVYHFDIKNGAYLNSGDRIGLLADLSHLHVRAFVDEPEMGRLKPAADAVIRWDAYPNAVLRGKVQRLPSQVVTLGSRSVAEVICNVEDPGKLLVPNVNVDVEILTGGGASVPVLPRSAIFPEGNKQYVWIERDGHAVMTFVKTGRSTPDLIEVTEGLSSDDRVIIPGDTPITSGMKVRIAEE